MAFWNSTKIITVNDGVTANDGTGDAIRDAFIKVNNNFANVSAQFSDPAQNFLNANIEFNLSSTNATITNIFASNALSTYSNVTANVQAANVISTSGLYSISPTYLMNETYVAGNIIPTTPSKWNLGSPTSPFANLYVVQTVSTSQLNQSTDAGILLIHANSSITGTTDVGIMGNVTFDTNGNSYAFFGFRQATRNFVYEITPTNAATGNGVVVGGVYGNIQVGSGLFANTTTSSSTTSGALIVAGGAGIGGNVNIGGNINISGNALVGGYQVVTTNTPGINFYSGISGFNAPIVSTSVTPSTSISTGAWVLSYGGAGIAGNLNVGGNVNAPSFNGNVYGAQNYIDSLSIGNGSTTISNSGSINTGYISTTSIGVTSLTVTGTANFGGASILGLVNFSATGNATIGNVSAYQFNGRLQGTVLTSSQPNITTIGNLTGLEVNNGGISSVGNVTAGNVSGAKGTFTSVQGTLITPAQSNITSLGTLTGLSVTGALTVTGNTAITNTVYAQGIYDNGTRVVSTSTNSGNLTISGTVINLTPTGPGVTTVGSTTAIPVITTDAYGRISNLTTVNISTTLPIAGNTGSSTVALANQTLTIGGGANVSTSASGQTVIINSTDTLDSVVSRGSATFTSITLNGQLNMGASIIPSANVSYNLGSSANWWNTIYGTAVHAQYADVAEKYVADQKYDAGTVVIFGGDSEITTTTQFADPRVAGAISTDPALLMNGASPGLPVALRGRIPLKIIGPVNKGDLLVTAATPGYATSVGLDISHGLSVFAKSLTTDLTNGQKIIEAVII